MKTFFRSLFFVVVFFSFAINAQNNQKYSGLFLEKQSIAGNKNLKYSVKTVYFKMGNFKQSLSNSDKSRVIIDNDIRNFAYLNLDQYGRIKTIRNSIAGDRYLSNIDYKKTEDYLYDERDWAEKSKYKTKLKQYYPVMNHSLLLKLNSTEVQKEEVIMGGKIFQELSKDVYIYMMKKEE